MIGERLTSCVGALLFCIAVTLALGLVSGIEGMAEQVCGYEQDSDSMIERSQREKVLTEPAVTYEQIVAELMNDNLNYDVIVDRKQISPNDYNMTMINDYLPFRERSYLARYRYDADGQVICVEYYGK